MIRSFRFRITAWYLAFFSALFVLFGLFLYGVLSRSLETRLDETLVSQSATAAGLFLDEIEEMKGDLPKAAAEAVAEVRLPGSTIAIFNEGRLLASNIPVNRLPELPNDGPTERLLHLPGVHAALRRVDALNRTFTVVAFARLDSIADNLAIVRRVLIFGMPILLAIAGLGGYLVATRSLAPLHAMADQARRITGSTLHSRLEIGNAADELTTLAASFNELLGRLDQSFESMRRFVADASHELRTPIAVIRGEADVALSHDRGSGEYRESLAIILDESRRLSGLIDDLLNLARADAGRVKLQMRDFYFNDLVSDCCRSMQTAALARRIDLQCRTAAADIPFHGDEELLRRLVLNLLDNAIRYTPPGGQVSASVDSQPEGVRLRISDNGMGIPPEAAPYIFERFFRADKARSRDDGGFGLGLSIVKWIAESHRGAVELESRPTAGSTFTVRLPQ